MPPRILSAKLSTRISAPGSVPPFPTRSLRKVPPCQEERYSARDDVPVLYRSKLPNQPASSSWTIREPLGSRDRTSATFSGVASLMTHRAGFGGLGVVFFLGFCAHFA